MDPAFDFNNFNADLDICEKLSIIEHTNERQQETQNDFTSQSFGTKTARIFHSSSVDLTQLHDDRSLDHYFENLVNRTAKMHLGYQVIVSNILDRMNHKYLQKCVDYETRIKKLECMNENLCKALESHKQCPRFEITQLKIDHDYLFIYDHRIKNYHVPSSKNYYFLVTNDPIYTINHEERPPFFYSKVTSIRRARTTIKDNRFHLNPGTVFYLVERGQLSSTTITTY